MARSIARHAADGAVSQKASIAVGLCQTLMLFALTTLPTPLYGDYARIFHFPVLTLTLIYATYVAGTLSMLFLFGRVSDQIGRRPVALCAVAAAALAVILFIMADSVAMLFAARLMTGFAAGLSSGTTVVWLRELHSEREQKQASLRTVAINLLGLGAGPLLCGLLAEFAPSPMRLPYLAYGVLLAPLAVFVLLARETVSHPKSLDQIKLGLMLDVPRKIVMKFMAPGITTFVLYSLVGFYSALVPGLLSRSLHLANHALAGGLVFELFAVGAVTVYLTQKLISRAAMLWGAVLMLPALGLLVAAELLASLPALIAAMAAGGLSLGVGYRGALQKTSRIAPDNKRAQLMSLLFVCGNLGMALPVIGIGVVSTLATPRLADLAFAGLIALLSLTGFGLGLAERT